MQRWECGWPTSSIECGRANGPGKIDVASIVAVAELRALLSTDRNRSLQVGRNLAQQTVSPKQRIHKWMCQKLLASRKCGQSSCMPERGLKWQAEQMYANNFQVTEIHNQFQPAETFSALTTDSPITKVCSTQRAVALF